MNSLHRLDGSYASIIGVSRIRTQDTGKLVDDLRSGSKVSIQAVSAQIVYGIEHVLGALRITLEAEKRKVMLANRRETELLLRLACADQISEALKRAGLKDGTAGCFIAISDDSAALQQFADRMEKKFDIDNSVFEPSREKKKILSAYLGLPAGTISDGDFLQYLLERAAILTK